jgi:hypothetical protein
MRQLILLTLFALLPAATFGQSTRHNWAKAIPDSMVWNLGPSAKEEVLMLSPRGVGDIPSESSIWERPDEGSRTVKIAAVKPSDLGFGLGFNVQDFIIEVKKRFGYIHCPQWVPVQAYITYGRSKSHLFFYTGEGEKYWCFGLSEDGLRNEDLWLRKPDGRPDSIWIFVIP